MIYINKFDTAKGIMIAMCDEELIGRNLKEGKIEINLKQYSGFYRGELVSEEDAKNMITDQVYSANVVGDRSVGILVEKGLVKAKDVKKVQGIKFVYLFRVLK